MVVLNWATRTQRSCLKVDFNAMARQSDPVNVASSDPPVFETKPRDPRLAQWLTDYPPSVFSERLHQSIELMERYSIELAIDVLRKLDVIDRLEHWRSPDEVCQLLSFQPRFSSTLAWLLERLVETGCIEVRRDGDARVYRLRQRPWPSELAELRALGLTIDSGNAATLDLLDHAAGIYPVVARGEQSGDQSLFGAKGIALWLNYFQNDNLTYAVNNWVGAVLAANRLSSRPKLRILEIGAGAGSGTEILLRWFEQRGLLSRVERYLVTEPNPFFRRRAQRELTNRYADLPLEWGTLDLNVQWNDQGVALGEFDLVYAVNVMHVAKDLLFSLNQGRSALTNDGWLVIGECVRPYVNQPIYPEMMFQNLESFTDVCTDRDFRPTPGFLTAGHWLRAFARAGFARTEVAPDIEKIRAICPHFFTGAICGQRTSQSE
jgi:SAM-dependent methyltransferase